MKSGSSSIFMFHVFMFHSAPLTLSLSRRERGPESPRQRELLAHVRWHRSGPDPFRPLKLLAQREPRADARVGFERPAHDLRAVALAAAVQQHDVLGQASPALLAAVEDRAHRLERLAVGEVAAAA